VVLDLVSGLADDDLSRTAWTLIANSTAKHLVSPRQPCGFSISRRYDTFQRSTETRQFSSRMFQDHSLQQRTARRHTGLSWIKSLDINMQYVQLGGMYTLIKLSWVNQVLPCSNSFTIYEHRAQVLWSGAISRPSIVRMCRRSSPFRRACA
jgi:hypothetical protein